MCEACCKEYTAAQEEFTWRNIPLELPEAVPTSETRWRTESFDLRTENVRVERGENGNCTLVIDGRFRLILRVWGERIVLRFRRRMRINVPCDAVDCEHWRITGELTDLRFRLWNGSMDVSVRIQIRSCCKKKCPELTGTWECCNCSCSCGSGSGISGSRPWILPDGSSYYTDYACPCSCGKRPRPPRPCGCGR